MIVEEYRDLVTQLADRTREGRVNWKPTSDESEFLVLFRNVSLTVRSGVDYEEHEYFIQFRLRDADGKELDSFVVSSGQQDWTLVNELYERARRKARNVDGHVKEILSELSSPGPFGRDDDAP